MSAAEVTDSVAHLLDAVLWPAVAVFTVRQFRAPLAALIGRARSIKAGPLAITADPQVMAAVKELADPRTDVDAERRREQIDRVLTHGAEWGWSMARAGFVNPPRPQIEWTAGEPRIVVDPSS